MKELAKLFLLLAEPVRLQLLALLSIDEKCVCELYDPLGIPQSTASRHLAQLRTMGIVEANRKGVWMHYRLSPEHWKPIWVEPLNAAIKAAHAELPVELKVSSCCSLVTVTGEKLRKQTTASRRKPE
ncbi:MAG: metalloregulator ArsR/SmtB family transcription factor [bacterium]|nr:metalloregulator ArsR/SmtB family transcription factor [bacterium]